MYCIGSSDMMLPLLPFPSLHFADTLLSKTLLTPNTQRSKVEDVRLAMVYNTSDLLDTLLDGYDKKLRPNFGGNWTSLNTLPLRWTQVDTKTSPQPLGQDQSLNCPKTFMTFKTRVYRSTPDWSTTASRPVRSGRPKTTEDQVYRSSNTD